MINLDQAIEIIKNTLFLNQDKSITGLSVDSNYFPDYNIYNNLTPDICKNRENRKICISFYKYSSTQSREITCPFGVNLKIENIKASNKEIRLITQIKHNSKLIDINKIYSLPRKSKKYLKKFLNYKFEKYTVTEAYLFHEYIANLFLTLLYGRVVLSMKALSHQIFTPIQGAMADRDNIIAESDIDASIKRLDKNLRSIELTAKQIQVLLSEEVEFQPNLLKSIRIKPLVNEIIELSESTAADKNLKFIHGHNNISESIQAIPSHLKIVLSNIIGNAVKYSYRGFDDRPKEIRIDYENGEDKYLIIKVSNLGTPISYEEIRLGKIFELGYRGAHSTDRDRSGTGTGLHIAFQLTQAHQGRIEVTSKEVYHNRQLMNFHKVTFKLFWPFVQS